MWIEFHRQLSATLLDRGIRFAEFKVSREYRDVELELRDCDDPIRVAAVALSELRCGDSGPMDQSVLVAVGLFLDDNAIRIRDDTSGVERYIEMDEAPCDNARACEECIRRWYSTSGSNRVEF